MAERKQRYIAVIGGGSSDSETSKLAEDVGREIANSNSILVCGGLGGVMESACKGAKEAGGTTIGILPGNDYHDGNDFLDHAICTGVQEARNLAVVLTSDAVIALKGEYGTLSEISFALKYNKPVISIGSWNISNDIKVAKTAQEAVNLILRELKR